MNENQKTGIQLDEEAQKLFELLGGIDTRETVRPPQPASSLSEALNNEENKIDNWRILMVEFIYLFTAYLTSVRLSGFTPKHKEDIDSMLSMLKKMSQRQDKESDLLIRYKGMSASKDKKGTNQPDYSILCRNILVDLSVSKAIAKRKMAIAAHLPGRLSGAFSQLSSMGINTVCIMIGNWSHEQENSLRITLEVLPLYYKNLNLETASGQRSTLQNGPFPIIYNEIGLSDPNLTLITWLNNLNRQTIDNLVKKVKDKMDSPGLEQYSTVYGAMFAFKNIRDQLIKPPIEINNVKWLLADNSQTMISKEKAQLARSMTEMFGDNFQMVAESMRSLYGNDFTEIESEALETRLSYLTEYLNRIQNISNCKTLEKEVFKNIEERFEDVQEDVLDGLFVHTASKKTDDGPTNRTRIVLHSKLLELVSFFKNKSVTRKKINELLNHSIDFDNQDYETIARDFDISVEDAKNLLELLKSCFDSNGHFLRGAFEKNIPAFAKYERKVFEFLWKYLKDIRSKNDRVAYLNSLQSLILQMQQTEKAVKLLLKDFCQSSQKVTFPDRNALMLTNVLLRKYNKESRTDIEITPEELLLIKNGLNNSAVNVASEYLDEKQELFFKKVRTIHELIKMALAGNAADKKNIPIGFCISLEREFYILISLIGGNAAHKIVRNALMEYGNPDSEIYLLKNSGKHAATLLKLLQVIIRGLGRFQIIDDLPLFEDIKNSEGNFIAMSRENEHKELVKRVMSWVNIAIENVSFSY